jgi:hypothetical protein
VRELCGGWQFGAARNVGVECNPRVFRLDTDRSTAVGCIKVGSRLGLRVDCLADPNSYLLVSTEPVKPCYRECIDSECLHSYVRWEGGREEGGEQK